MYSIEMCVLWAKEMVCYCFGEILSRESVIVLDLESHEWGERFEVPAVG